MESLFTFCRWRRPRHSFFSPCDQMQPFDLWCHAAFTVTSTGEKVATNNNCVCRERLLVSQQLLLLLLTTSTVPPTSQVKLCLIYSCCLWPYHSVMLVDGEAAGWGALTSQNSNMFSVSMPKSFTLGCGRKRERHRARERERESGSYLWTQGEDLHPGIVSWLTPFVDRATKCLATADFC